MNEDKQSIIEKLKLKIKNLEEDINKLVEEVSKRRTQLNIQKEINKENKIIKGMKAKTKRKLKIIKNITNKDIRQGIDETQRLNQVITVKENLTNNKLREKEDIMEQVKGLERDMKHLKETIENKTQSKKSLDLNLIDSRNKIKKK